MSAWRLVPLRWFAPAPANVPQSTSSSSLVESAVDCTFSNESSRSCTTETRDGVTYERCKAYFSLMRNCPGRPPEEVMKKETETLRMLDEAELAESSPGPSSSMVVTPEVGQMFDEFFNFAAEIERDLLSKHGDLHASSQASRGLFAADDPGASSSGRALWLSSGKSQGDSKSQLYELFGRNMQQV